MPFYLLYLLWGIKNAKKICKLILLTGCNCQAALYLLKNQFHIISNDNVNMDLYYCGEKISIATYDENIVVSAKNNTYNYEYIVTLEEIIPNF